MISAIKKAFAENITKQGYTVRIKKDDGSFSEQYFASIEADVHRYFPNSEAVNNALRSLIVN
jgi:hypothetical protein